MNTLSSYILFLKKSIKTKVCPSHYIYYFLKNNLIKQLYLVIVKTIYNTTIKHLYLGLTQNYTEIGNMARIAENYQFFLIPLHTTENLLTYTVFVIVPTKFGII